MISNKIPPPTRYPHTYTLALQFYGYDFKTRSPLHTTPCGHLNTNRVPDLSAKGGNIPRCVYNIPKCVLKCGMKYKI